MDFIGISLVTDDVPALTEFYSRVTGLKFVGDAVHAEARLGGVSFSIYSRAASGDQLGWDLPAGTLGGTVTLMFRVDDVDAEYLRLKAFVPRLLNEPETRPWGARSFQFLDPDGNIVGLVTPPSDR